MKKVSIIIIALVIITSCSRKMMNEDGGKYSSSNRTYVVKDSVYFNLIDSQSSAHKGLKEYSIKLTQIDSSNFLATYSCSADYFLDCACQIRADENPIPFEIRYKVNFNLGVVQNDNIEVVDVSDVKEKLQNIYDNKTLDTKCEKMDKKIESFLKKEDDLKRKFKYMLSHIHRYERMEIPKSVQSINKSKYETVEFDNIIPFANISECSFENQSNKLELAIWKTNVSSDRTHLKIMNVSNLETSNNTKMDSIGNEFLEDKLKYLGTSNTLFEHLHYEMDNSKNIMTQFQLKLRTENDLIIHHMDKTIKIK